MFDVPIMTAIFAAIATFHNTLSRYLWALDRRSLVWSRMWSARLIVKTPHASATVQPIGVCLAAPVAGPWPSLPNRPDFEQVLMRDHPRGNSSTEPDSRGSVQENRQPIAVVRVHQYEEQNEVED